MPRLATLAASLLLLSSWLAGAGCGQEAHRAPEIDAGHWYNVQGEAPTLAHLRGKAVLLEFWATW
jgi:hypothetical protein